MKNNWANFCTIFSFDIIVTRLYLFLKNNRNAYSSVRIWKLFNLKCDIFLRRSGYPTLYTYYLHHNKLIYINGKCRLNLLSSIQLKRMIGRIETGKAWSVVFSFLEFCYASNCKEKVAKQVEHNAFSLLYFIGSILKATFSL